ncbi:MAG: hypothetical protein IT529_14265 [Burkholderiales bacterium]|nr:hypothetical protein [Burkholderiales bacterium]
MRAGPAMSPSWRALLAAACLAFVRPLAADVFVHEDIIVDPSPSRLSVCHGFSCTIVTQVDLTPAQWAEVSAPLAAARSGPEAERAQIALAIARFEQVVGTIAGTAGDMPENRPGSDWRAQMDCIDESTNTTTYLRILQRAGLLRWHRVVDRVTRGFFLFGMPHTTAVVSENAGGRRWAVDSWFYANGEPPVIVPLETWRQVRWRPEAPARAARTP